MKIDILTLFPEMFESPFAASIIKRAREKGLIHIEMTNIRDFAHDKHRIVDDYPFGGGAGMVMKPEPILEAVDFVTGRREPGEKKAKVLLMCPKGRVFNQEIARELAREEHLVVICGHYEGIDERVRAEVVDDEISIGDFVLTGGELPAMIIVDAVARMIPGVLGEEQSFVTDSFFDGLLEYPQYTRPREFAGHKVPDILLSGNHEQIRLWRRKMSLERTLKSRPDLLKYDDLSPEDKKLLEKQFD